MNKIYFVISSFIFCMFFNPAFAAHPPTPFEKACVRAVKAKGSAHDRLWKLFQTHMDYLMNEYPEWATYMGIPGHNAQLTDQSADSIARRNREIDAPLKALAQIDRKKLSAMDQDNYDLFKYNLERGREGREFPGELMPLTQLNGIQQEIAALLETMPTATAQDFQDRIARLKKTPLAIDQTIALLKDGLKKGITPTRIALRDVPAQVKAQEEPDPKKNPLLISFLNMPESISAADRKRLFEDAAAVLKSDVIPAFARLREYLEQTYVPQSRETIAWESLPNGKRWYAFQVKNSTTTKMTPDELHELGLKEVARIRAEMDKVMAATGFSGNFEKFSRFLRTDKRFFFKTPEELIIGYRDIAKRIDPELPKLFGKLPRLTYGVKPVPAYSEKSQPTAYYQGGSPKIGRAGDFYANTYDLKTRPKWEMEALTLHEAVPGHHLQIALAQEMEDLPEFRKEGGYSAFVEGWGLYAESLGGELGLYKDPYSKFGQLTYEMWRAIRLVVDTGMHSKGWTREQAIEFFKKNSSKSEHDIVVEIDRYIVWAGQALAYKTGELKIKALRSEAQKELGTAFNIRKFHDAVLDRGAVPLDNLEINVRKWIADQRRLVKSEHRM